jgi:hypothetical protein
MKRFTRRQSALAAALGLTVAATAWVSLQDDATPAVAATARRTTGAAPPGATPPPDWPAAPGAPREAWPDTTPLARQAWGEVAAPPLTAATPTPVAIATAAAEPEDAALPPFPYQLVGRMTDSRPHVVLDGPRRSWVLGVGDVVDNQWRIDAIEPGGLRLMRLPDGPSQFIAFSAP